MEEEASREEGTDFSKGRNDNQKTTKEQTSFHLECPDVAELPACSLFYV